MNRDLIKWVNFDVKGDERGSLNVIESSKDVPFQIERIYYIYGTRTGVTRGYHAHKDLKQVLIAISGSCNIKLDDGEYSTVVHLSSPERGIYLDSLLWREMSDFSSDCVLLCIASSYYDEDDYIRDYAEFKSYVLKRG
ncbi:sugar 3,4-ketoisomerase [Rubritalea tangerina]|uniref:Sugar 3,4-ketoisomerase n=1 Tax=Rubritalea tangerina TaxID=430798 RepID=A0ABW4ZCF9_9BACT